MNVTVRVVGRGKNVEYRLVKVMCGKANCTRCPHGPYWYAHVRRIDGTIIRRYVGKVAPRGIDE